MMISPRTLLISRTAMLTVDIHWSVCAAAAAVAHRVAARAAAESHRGRDERECVERGGEGIDVGCCCCGGAVLGGRVFFDERAVCEGARRARRWFLRGAQLRHARRALRVLTRGGVFCFSVLVSVFVVLPMRVCVARLPVAPDHARALAPFLEEPADALVRDGEEELFWVAVGFDEVQPAGLGQREDAVAFDKVACKLYKHITQTCMALETERTTYDLLAAFLPQRRDGVMVLRLVLQRFVRHILLAHRHRPHTNSSSRASGKTHPHPCSSQTCAWYVA